MKDGVEYFNTIAPDTDVNLLYTGYEHCPPAKRVRGVRSHFLLHYIEDGYGFVQDSNRRFHVGPGDMFCYFPHHAMDYQATDSQPWTFYWIGFQGRRAEAILRQCGFSEYSIVCNQELSQHVTALFSHLLHIQHQRSIGFDLISDGVLLQLLGSLSQHVHLFDGEHSPASNSIHWNNYPIRQQNPHYYVAEMKRFMQVNFQKPIRVEQVVNYIGIERSYASRIFRKLENRTLQQYLIELRMHAAQRMLAEHRYSIESIAYAVGYTSYTSFERCFRTKVGCAPSEY